VARKEKAPKAPKAPKGPGRIKQIREAYQLSKKHDPKIGLFTAGAFLLPFALALGLGFLLSSPIVFAILGLLLGMVVSLSIFSRRAQRASYASVAGTPGVAAAVVERMRGQWIVNPAVQLNRDQDLVHRVLGRCGVVLLAEGRGSAQLVGPEVRRLRKVLGEIPITTLMIGDGEGQTPLHKIQVSMVKLPRVLSQSDVVALDRRLKALPGAGTPLPVPKGPMPTRMPKGSRR
jgi:hypothetical protein